MNKNVAFVEISSWKNIWIVLHLLQALSASLKFIGICCDFFSNSAAFIPFLLDPGWLFNCFFLTLHIDQQMHSFYVS